MKIYWICYKNHKADFSPIFFPYADQEKRNEEYEKMKLKTPEKDLFIGQTILL